MLTLLFIFFRSVEISELDPNIYMVIGLVGEHFLF